MLDLELMPEAGARTLWDVETLSDLSERPITTADHCFGCTAGAGGSGGGTIE